MSEVGMSSSRRGSASVRGLHGGARPRTYFSFRSPYSWLAFRDMQIRYPQLVLELEWIPYWDPDDLMLRRLGEDGADYVYVAMSKEKHRYLLQDVRRQTRRRGLTVTWPWDDGVIWEPAHLGFFAATRAGLGLEYVDRVFTARWTQGAEIGNVEVIAQLADDIGLDGATLTEDIQSSDIRDDGADALARAYDDDVFGPPFFIAGREKFWGLDRLDEFADFCGAEPTSQPGAETVDVGVTAGFRSVGADVSHAGGCG